MCCGATRDRLGTLLARRGRELGVDRAAASSFSFPANRRRSNPRPCNPPTIPPTVRAVSVSQVQSRCSFYLTRTHLRISVAVVVVALALLPAAGRFLRACSRYRSFQSRDWHRERSRECVQSILPREPSRPITATSSEPLMRGHARVSNLSSSYDSRVLEQLARSRRDRA